MRKIDCSEASESLERLAVTLMGSTLLDYQTTTESVIINCGA